MALKVSNKALKRQAHKLNHQNKKLQKEITTLTAENQAIVKTNGNIQGQIAQKEQKIQSFAQQIE